MRLIPPNHVLPRAVWFKMIKINKQSPRVEARWAVVHALKSVHWDVARAARLTRKPAKFVRHWKQRYVETGTVDDSPRTGRPGKISAAVRAQACTLLAEEQSVPAVTALLKDQQVIDSSISYKTIGRAVAHDMELRPVEQRPILSANSRKKRVKWCKQQHNPNRVMAIDSTYFTLGTVQKRRKYWVMKGQPVIAGRPNHNAQVHVYGGITAYGKTSLRRVTGTTGHPEKYYNSKGQMTGVGAEEFQEVLGQTLVPEAQQIFAAAGVQQWSLLQDNAPAHTAGTTKTFISSHNIPVLAGWPPNSPDLNPIENAWAWCKQRVYSKHHNTLDELWTAVQEAWAALPLPLCENLMASMQRRKQICLQRDGGYTGY